MNIIAESKAYSPLNKQNARRGDQKATGNERSLLKSIRGNFLQSSVPRWWVSAKKGRKRCVFFKLTVSNRNSIVSLSPSKPLKLNSSSKWPKKMRSEDWSLKIFWLKFRGSRQKPRRQLKNEKHWTSCNENFTTKKWTW